jgi:hypothetical protein
LYGARIEAVTPSTSTASAAAQDTSAIMPLAM